MIKISTIKISNKIFVKCSVKPEQISVFQKWQSTKLTSPIRKHTAINSCLLGQSTALMASPNSFLIMLLL